MTDAKHNIVDISRPQKLRVEVPDLSNECNDELEGTLSPSREVWQPDESHEQLHQQIALVNGR